MNITSMEIVQMEDYLNITPITVSNSSTAYYKKSEKQNPPHGLFHSYILIIALKEIK